MKGIDSSLFTVQDKNGKLNLFAISLPLFLQLISNNVLQMINTAILSNYDSNLVTAMNASGTLINFLFAICTFAATGLNILLSRSLGSDDRHVIENVGVNALFLTVACGLGMAGIGFVLREPLLSLMHLEGEAMTWAKSFFALQLFTNMLLSSITNCFSDILRCYGKVVYVVIIGISVSALSALNMSLLAFTPLGSYFKMIDNCRINNVIVVVLQFLLTFLVFKLQKLPFGKKLDKKLFVRLTKVGVPGSVSNVSYTLSGLLTTSIISLMDPTFINIKVYCNTIFNYICFFGLSIGQSGGVLIGRVVGSGDVEKAKKMHKLYLFSIVTIDVILAVAVFFLRNPLFSLFDKNPEHLALIAPIFALDILVEAGRGVNHACQYSLNVVGDVAYTTLISIASCWMSAVLMAYLFAVVFGFGLIGCWIAFALDEWTRAILYEIRWRTGKWEGKTM